MSAQENKDWALVTYGAESNHIKRLFGLIPVRDLRACIQFSPPLCDNVRDFLLQYEDKRYVPWVTSPSPSPNLLADTCKFFLTALSKDHIPSRLFPDQITRVFVRSYWFRESRAPMLHFWILAYFGACLPQGTWIAAVSLPDEGTCACDRRWEIHCRPVYSLCNRGFVYSNSGTPAKTARTSFWSRKIMGKTYILCEDMNDFIL